MSGIFSGVKCQDSQQNKAGDGKSISSSYQKQDVIMYHV